jgi:hypothetical protein
MEPRPCLGAHPALALLPPGSCAAPDSGMGLPSGNAVATATAAGAWAGAANFPAAKLTLPGWY